MGGCVSTRSVELSEAQPIKSAPAPRELKSAAPAHQPAEENKATPSTPPLWDDSGRTEACSTSVASPACFSSGDSWAFTADAEPDPARPWLVQPKATHTRPPWTPSSVPSTPEHGHHAADHNKTFKAKPCMGQVTRTLAWKVAARTKGKWTARVEVPGKHDAEFYIALKGQEHKVKAVLHAHFPTAFPEVPCVVSYKGPRYDTSLDVELAVGFPNHSELTPENWTRYTKLADIIMPAVIGVLDAHDRPLPEPRAELLVWNDVEERMLWLVHPRHRQQVNEGPLRGVFRVLRQMLEDVEGDAGNMDRLVHFGMLEWMEGLVERIERVVVPLAEYDEAVYTLGRLYKVLVKAYDGYEEEDEGRFDRLRSRVHDVTKRWAIRRRAMLKGERKACVGDLWAWVLGSAKLGGIRGPCVEKAVSVVESDHDDSHSEALRKFVSGAREQGLLTGPYWNTLALAYQLISNGQATVASIPVPTKQLDDVLHKGFEALSNKPRPSPIDDMVVVSQDGGVTTTLSDGGDGDAAAGEREGHVDVRTALRDELKAVLAARNSPSGVKPIATVKSISHVSSASSITCSVRAAAAHKSLTFMDPRAAIKEGMPPKFSMVLALVLIPPAVRTSLEYDAEGSAPIWQVKKPSNSNITYALPLGVAQIAPPSKGVKEHAD